MAITVAVGEEVAAGQKLATLEAMKMETTLYAERAGKVAEVLVRPGILAALRSPLRAFVSQARR